MFKGNELSRASKSKKTEVLRVTKDESRLITLLREMDLEDLVSELNESLRERPSQSLQTLRSVLKSEFIPPFSTLSISPSSLSLVSKAFKENTDIYIVGANRDNRIAFLKSFLMHYQQNLVDVALLDSTRALANSSCLINSRVTDLTPNRDSQVTLYNLMYDNTRLVVNTDTTIEDYIVLMNALLYGLPLIWSDDTHPLESLALSGYGGSKLRVHEVIKDKIAEKPYILIQCHSDLGSDGYKYGVSQIEPTLKV